MRINEIVDPQDQMALLQTILNSALYTIRQQAEMQAIYAHDTSLNEGTSTWMKNLRASVRPVITYGFFLLLVGIDASLAWHGFTTNVPFNEMADQLWDDNTQALFASIIAFHFGGRAFGK